MDAVPCRRPWKEAAELLERACQVASSGPEGVVLENLDIIERDFLQLLHNRPNAVLIEVFGGLHSKGRQLVSLLAHLLLTRHHTNQIYRILTSLLRFHEFRSFLRRDGRLTCFLVQRLLVRDPEVPLELTLLIPWKELTDPSLLAICAKAFVNSNLYWYDAFQNLDRSHGDLRKALLDQFVRRLESGGGKPLLLLCFNAIVRLAEGYTCKLLEPDNVDNMIRVCVDAIRGGSALECQVACDFLLAASNHEQTWRQMLTWWRRGLLSQLLDPSKLIDPCRSNDLMRFISDLLSSLKFTCTAMVASKDMNGLFFRSLSGFGLEAVYAARIFVAYLREADPHHLDPLTLQEIDQEVAHLLHAYKAEKKPRCDSCDPSEDAVQVLLEYVRLRGDEFRRLVDAEALSSSWGTSQRDVHRGGSEPFLLVENYNLASELASLRRQRLPQLENELRCLRTAVQDAKIETEIQTRILEAEVAKLRRANSELEADKALSEATVLSLKAELRTQQGAIEVLHASLQDRDAQLRLHEEQLATLKTEMDVMRQPQSMALESLYQDHNKGPSHLAMLASGEERLQSRTQKLVPAESQTPTFQIELATLQQSLLASVRGCQGPLEPSSSSNKENIGDTQLTGSWPSSTRGIDEDMAVG